MQNSQEGRFLPNINRKSMEMGFSLSLTSPTTLPKKSGQAGLAATPPCLTTGRLEKEGGEWLAQESFWMRTNGVQPNFQFPISNFNFLL